MQGIITSRENTGQTAAEILAAAKNINNPDNVVGHGLIEAQFANRTFVGTRETLINSFKDYLDGNL